MKKLILALLSIVCLGELSAQSSVMIIRCVARSQVAFAKAPANASFKTLDMASDTTDRVCYPGVISFTLPSYNCQSPDIASQVLRLELTASDTLMAGDALTIDAVSNMNFTDGSSDIAEGGFTPVADERAAVIVTNDNFTAIEFTRDPSQPSSITFRNADVAGGGKTITIPACDPALLANPIPTVGEWALMILGLGTLIFGVVAYRQRTVVLN